MKTPRLLTLIAATLLCAALPQSSPAADVVVELGVIGASHLLATK